MRRQCLCVPVCVCVGMKTVFFTCALTSSHTVCATDLVVEAAGHWAAAAAHGHPHTAPLSSPLSSAVGFGTTFLPENNSAIGNTCQLEAVCRCGLEERIQSFAHYMGDIKSFWHSSLRWI